MQSLGAEVVAIGTGTPRQARDYQSSLDLPYPILADPTGHSYDRFNIGRWALGLLRQSAVFVIDAEGRIVYGRMVNNPRGALVLIEVKSVLQQAGKQAT